MSYLAAADTPCTDRFQVGDKVLYIIAAIPRWNIPQRRIPATVYRVTNKRVVIDVGTGLRAVLPFSIVKAD